MQLIVLLATLLSLLPFSPWVTADAACQQAKSGLADYIGTWVGHTSDGEFKLVLEERTIHFKHFKPNSRDYDMIKGRHSYVTASGVKNESLSRPVGEYILSGMPDPNNPEQILGTFDDDITHKSFQVNMSFVGGNKTQLLWKILRANEYVNFDPNIKVLPGVSVPTSVVLTKVQ